jgi:hypothetical protein
VKSDDYFIANRKFTSCYNIKMSNFIGNNILFASAIDYKDYTVGYAKSNQSQCRGCEEKIAKVYCPL